MRLKNIIVIGLLLPICSYGNHLDDLEKYSYRIIIFSGGVPDYFGTCFFVKHKSDTYVISNYHVFTGINPYTYERKKTSSDSIVILISNHSYRLKINSDSLRLNSPLIHFYEKSDFYIFKIKDPSFNKFKIKSVERFIGKYDKLNGKPDSVLAYGFAPDQEPEKPYSVEDIQKIKPFRYSSTIESSVSNNNNRDSSVWLNFYGKEDSINIYMNGVTMPGMSGSPLFYIYLKRNLITFGGIIFGGGKKGEVLAFAVKPRKFIDSLNNIISKEQ